jgi:hypothetical protein
VAAVRRPPDEATARRWSLRLVVATAILAAVWIVAGFAVGGEAPRAADAPAILAVLALAVAGAGVVALVVRTLPQRWRPLVLATTVLPLATAAGAAGLPETAIHFSDTAAWALRAGREISLGALAAGGALAAAIAWAYAYRPLAIAAVAALTLLGGAVGRDLVVREQQPGWCYAEEVTVGPGGSYSAFGATEGCTLLLEDRWP